MNTHKSAQSWRRNSKEELKDCVENIYIFFPTTTYYRHDRIAKPSNGDKPQNYLESYHQIHLDTEIVWQLKQLPNGRMTEVKKKKKKSQVTNKRNLHAFPMSLQMHPCGVQGLKCYCSHDDQLVLFYVTYFSLLNTFMQSQCIILLTDKTNFKTRV